MLRLLEPPDSCHHELLDRLYSGSYEKPFIVDNGQRRFLHFDFGAIQSAMEMRNPQRLALAYTRKMMAFLLFNRRPKRILLLGLGGGSLAKFCYGNLPEASLTAVEVSHDVIAMRDEFGIPEDDHRFRVVNANGSAYISVTTQPEDVILADACDRWGVRPAAVFPPMAYLWSTYAGTRVQPPPISRRSETRSMTNCFRCRFKKTAMSSFLVSRGNAPICVAGSLKRARAI